MARLPFLSLARGLLGLAVVLLSLIAVVGALALLVTATSAAIRATVPIPVVFENAPQPGQPMPATLTGWRHTLFAWAYSFESPREWNAPEDDPRSAVGREGQAAAADDSPLREFPQRCLASDRLQPAISQGGAGWRGPASGSQIPSDWMPPPVLPGAVIDVQQLGVSIYRDRIDAVGRIEQSFRTLQILTWAGIAVGLLTTVMVGLRASKLADADNATSKMITVLAIALPALGTAIAAVAAFYSPREELARASQLLAGLRQVHGQIAAQVRAIDCTDRDAAVKQLTERFPEWMQRLRDVQVIALAATGAGQEQGRRDGGQQPGGTQSQGNQGTASQRPAAPGPQ